MTIKRNATRDSFLREIEHARLYCYGAGNAFQDFLLLYPQVKVTAVIDKHLCEKQKEISDHNIPVISLDDFVGQYRNNDVLLITCFNYQDVQEELSREKKLETLNAYVYSMLEEMPDEWGETNEKNLYQIVEFRLQNFTAGQKAPVDVAKIAEKVGYQPLVLCRGTISESGKRQSAAEWQDVCDKIADNATVLVQLPTCDQSDGIDALLKIKREKGLKIIGILHDIDIFRGEQAQYNKRQYELLSILADLLIVHNQKMIDLLVEQGFSKDMLIDLEIFDYLVVEEPKELPSDGGVVIAGNLSTKKSEYIGKLHEIKEVNFNLFGANYEEKKESENIRYFGSFLPDELISKLQGSYGLVWDGDSVETCRGATGRYLKINNPHKLSLYLAVGLPVIIWSEAAEADFVLREGVGITVRSLHDLPEKLAEVAPGEYRNMKQNAKRIGEKLRAGAYMRKALEQAEQKLRSKE